MAKYPGVKDLLVFACFAFRVDGVSGAGFCQVDRSCIGTDFGREKLAKKAGDHWLAHANAGGIIVENIRDWIEEGYGTSSSVKRCVSTSVAS